jgi:trigger factor
MRATAAPIEGNRVRLSVEVDESEVDEAMSATVRRLARQVRVPGFRPGKVPRPVLEARLGGAGALRQQAISDALPDLYAKAVADTEVDPIAPPDIDITSGKDSGAITFDATVEVRPTVSIAGYQGLVVTIPTLEVSEEEVDAQVTRLREQTGELTAVGRPSRDGDYVTIDLHASGMGGDDQHLEDYLYEVGSGAALPGLDEHLRGVKPGDIVQFTSTVTAPDGTEHTASVRVLVKDVKEKVLPEPTDEWAAEASEFDTLDALRDDIRKRLQQVKQLQGRVAWQEGTSDALVGLVDEAPPDALVDSEVRERLHDLGHRLEARRINLDQFLAASGRDESGLLAEIREGAGRTVLLDLALRALAEAEDIQVSEEDLDEALQAMGERAGMSSRELRRRLDRDGRLPAVRSEQRKAKALNWLLDHVELVDEEGRPVALDRLRGDVEAEQPTEQSTDAEARPVADGAEQVEREGEVEQVQDQSIAEVES